MPRVGPASRAGPNRLRYARKPVIDAWWFDVRVRPDPAIRAVTFSRLAFLRSGASADQIEPRKPIGITWIFADRIIVGVDLENEDAFYRLGGEFKSQIEFKNALARVIDTAEFPAGIQSWAKIDAAADERRVILAGP